MPTPHPSLETLRAFVAGLLDDEQSTRLEAHLEECDLCNQQLANDSGPDPFVDLIRQLEHSTNPGLAVTVVPESGSAAANHSRRHAPVAIRGYDILGELGRGGMGVVYRARHQQLKRDVALKVLLSGTHAGTHDRERFFREAETTARLRHSGIVQIFEIGEQDGHPFLALELVDGGTLQELAQGRPQPIRWAATMVLQLAGAVQFAHQQSVVHRDLKPGNILLCRTETTGSGSGEQWTPSVPLRSGETPLAVPTAKITDFGLARQMDSDLRLTRTGAAMGTPAYMAPEQAAGKSGPSVDIYALGAILYELLTGRPPFVEDDVFRTMRRVLDDDPDSPRVHRRDLPRDLETICLKCLMKEPARRYATARDLAVDLELFLRGEPILAKPLSLPGRLLRWARHRPLVAVTWLTCVVFYSLHLVAMLVLKLPQHTPFFHWLLTGLFLTWSGIAWVMQRLMEHRRDSRLGQYTFVIMANLSMTIALTCDSGPRSAPLPSYLLTIVMSALLVPTPRMTWTATGLAVAAYSWLLLHSAWFQPDHRVAPDTAIAFLLSLLVMGVLVHLLLRRAQPDA